MLRALAAQERQAGRARGRETHAGPKDDLDLEMDALLAAAGRPPRQQYGCAPLLCLAMCLQGVPSCRLWGFVCGG